MLAAVQADRRAGIEAGSKEIGQKEIGQMGDLSILLDRVLDGLDGWAGVTRLVVEVGSDAGVTTVTVVGQGDELERPVWPDQETGPSFVDPLTGSRFEWSPTAVTCSFRV